VDWGFDLAHSDFRTEDGSTRILALWDQRSTTRDDQTPQPYGYGTVHTAEAINHALTTGAPYAELDYDPADADVGRGAHGTHVASIAAGNGRGGGPVGLAPEADLVLVHLSNWKQQRPVRLGDSVTLLEAVDFITKTAANRPCVINLSMGRHAQQHDGTTLVEQALDSILASTPNTAIIQSAGNYFAKDTHASGTLRPGQKQTLIWDVAQADTTPNEMEIWYSSRDTFVFDVFAPNGERLAQVRKGQSQPIIVDGRTVGSIYHRINDPNCLDHLGQIFLYPEAPPGLWEIQLVGEDVIVGDYHAWIERDATCPGCQSRFAPEIADPTHTTGSICNGFRTIAVGAYNAHSPDQEVAPFSSCGRTRDHRIKPDLCAPGVFVLAARSAPHDSDNHADHLTRLSGTSMASPHVAGTVALMFQVARRPLRIEETRNLLCLPYEE
jgi:subtilisin family serine protease